MSTFKKWKSAFDQWESATAERSEKVMKRPSVLGPAGTVLSGLMKVKAAGNRAQANLWGALGLPTKRDQERTLHLLHQLESKICDLEEQLSEANRKLAAKS